MQSGKKGGFTMIEMLVAMTIFFIVASMTYVPYSYYQKKAKLRYTRSQISQVLQQAKNMAINGVVSQDTNQTVAVYFGKTKGAIETYGFDHTHNGGFTDTQSGVLLVSDRLEQGIQIDSIETHSGAVFIFRAITGSGEYHSLGTSTTPLTAPGIEISFSYKGAPQGTPLATSVEYQTATNIIDY